MEVILTEDVKNLGLQGELHDVADGYARNFLLPQGKAVNATEDNKQRFKKEQDEIEQRREKLVAEAEDRAERLQNVTLQLEKAAAEEGNLYGSVSQSDLVDALEEEGFEGLTAKQIILDEPIRELGEHTCRVSLAGNVEAEVKVEVVAG